MKLRKILKEFRKISLSALVVRGNTRKKIYTGGYTIDEDNPIEDVAKDLAQDALEKVFEFNEEDNWDFVEVEIDRESGRGTVIFRTKVK